MMRVAYYRSDAANKITSPVSLMATIFAASSLAAICFSTASAVEEKYAYIASEIAGSSKLPAISSDTAFATRRFFPNSKLVSVGDKLKEGHLPPKSIFGLRFLSYTQLLISAGCLLYFFDCFHISSYAAFCAGLLPYFI